MSRQQRALDATRLGARPRAAQEAPLAAVAAGAPSRTQRLQGWLLAALPPLGVLAGLLAAWELYVELSGINAVTLPAPSRIAETGWRNREALLDHSWVTLQETAAGMAVSVTLGVLLALLIELWAPLRRALYPLLVGSQTIPIIVIAPLLVLWFGFDLMPKVVVVTLYTFFPITVAFAAGLASADREALLLMRSLDAGRLTTLRLLQVPQALPHLFTGLRIAVTYAVVAAVFAEWVGARNGLGIYIALAKNSFRTDLVFAGVFVIAALSLGLFLLVMLLEKLIVRWK